MKNPISNCLIAFRAPDRLRSTLEYYSDKEMCSVSQIVRDGVMRRLQELQEKDSKIGQRSKTKSKIIRTKKNKKMKTFSEYKDDFFISKPEDIVAENDDLTEASFRNLSAAAALAIAISQRKKVMSKIREAKKPNTPIEDKLDLLGDALIHLAGAMTAVGAGAYKQK